MEAGVLTEWALCIAMLHGDCSDAWLQVRLAARPLAGSPGASPKGAVEGASPSSQGQSSAAGSPFSPVSSPEWHSTPRWPQYANFGAHSSRPAHPSTLSHVILAGHVLPADDLASQGSEVILI